MFRVMLWTLPPSQIAKLKKKKSAAYAHRCNLFQIETVNSFKQAILPSSPQKNYKRLMFRMAF